MPMRNLISILIATAIGVWAYFGTIERLNNLELRATLFEADLLKAADQKPIDNEQYMLIEFTATQLEKIQTEMSRGDITKTSNAINRYLREDSKQLR